MEARGKVGDMDQLETMGKVLQETQRVVDHIEPSQLDDPTPCTEYTVRDVIGHLVGVLPRVAAMGRASRGRSTARSAGRDRPARGGRDRERLERSQRELRHG